jgi:hypothetical protein
MIELTKSQKKKVRQLIEKGLMRDYLDGITNVRKMIDSYIAGKSDPKEYYHKLYSTMASKDKDIARRYDNLTGSRYLPTLIMLLREGVLSKEDIQDLDVRLKEQLLSLM